MGHGKHLSYNVQASVDKNGIVLETDVNTNGFDNGGYLKDRINSAEENTGKKVNTIVADAGYYETNAVKEIMESEDINTRDFIISQIPELSSEGDERKVFSFAEEFKVTSIGEDELNGGMKKTVISFKLNKGAYATVFIKELLS